MDQNLRAIKVSEIVLHCKNVCKLTLSALTKHERFSVAGSQNELSISMSLALHVKWLDIHVYGHKIML